MLHGPNLTDPPSRAGIEATIRAHSQVAAVANATVRNALVSGVTGITPANPVWVWRQDTAAIEMTTDGVGWRRWDETIDTDWQPATTGWTWGNSYNPAGIAFGGYPDFRWRRIGSTVTVQGGIKHTDADATAKAAVQIPAALRPASAMILPQGYAFKSIDAAGNIIAQTGATTFEYVRAEWLIG